ncbi:hypothetical protein [Paenibacillus sp. N3.4]|uniref:hypothetical protein n=1 Tax=Paenibacillus sp. N3.4 TaxID=2603222 RepID=UPI00164F4317|nr:hypothetical protein [Paenibacillus sp. N3.4]
MEKYAAISRASSLFLVVKKTLKIRKIDFLFVHTLSVNPSVNRFSSSEKGFFYVFCFTLLICKVMIKANLQNALGLPAGSSRTHWERQS